jgi:hypothetical protein
LTEEVDKPATTEEEEVEEDPYKKIYEKFQNDIVEKYNKT